MFTSPSAHPADQTLRRFLEVSVWHQRGAVITDLDGTVVDEHEGKIRIPEAVGQGLTALYRLGRPLILNTLRFPFSVMHTVGAAWYLLAKAPIPAILLNGSQLGHIVETPAGLVFEEVAAFPLTAPEIGEILEGIQGLITGGIDNLLVFYYPRDWQLGELIWTPDPQRVDGVRAKYLSASTVFSTAVGELKRRLLEQEILMMFLLIDAPADRLMAYQHTKRSSFFSHRGVDKLSGARCMAERLGIDLAHCIGAGDTEMDNFLRQVGLALIVGTQELDFRGQVDTLRLKDVGDLGQVLLQLARLQQEGVSG